MKQIEHGRRRVVAACVAGWVVLAAGCGGGGDQTPAGSGSPAGAPTTKGSFAAVVSFGDSLSDVGTYAPATSITGNGQPPYIGGKFTTNSATGTVWVENVATTLGLTITPAEVGFNGQAVACPAAAVPAAAGTCTGYGQGGSRVTNPAGIGHNADGSGALTVPVVTQIANHLARFGSFKASDLVFVYAGANDVLVNFSTFVATATQVQTSAAAGQLSADQANLQLANAQTAAQAAVKQAAQELAADVKTQILGKGATYVAVINLPDISLTPLGDSLPANVKPVLTGLSDTFNLWLRDGLTGVAVQLVDGNAAIKDVYNHPSTYGFTDVHDRACSATIIAALTANAVTDGSSLFCNATVGAPYYGLVTGADTSTWLFADSLHPTTGGQKVFSTFVLGQLKAYGWIS